MNTNDCCKGFTLIELIVIILILGVLAVTAAPRIMNINNSARVASLDSIAAAMESVITQVNSKAYIQGLTPDLVYSGNPNQSEYVIDFGIGSVEVDWATLCPESEGESADALTMLDFLTLETSGNLTTAIGNRHTVIGFNHSFSSGQLNSQNINTLPTGCYVIYDSFGGRTGGTCPTGGCVCSVRVENSDC
ncbi:prepilin-type N-terminal cleavage/methylation domain-containing protein [Vibrio tetraodonis]|uniref:prepilin-type N-terminal cleavage/methylation domain-containing protein n=1 Tax=Vibrio tetraodonis TaxID=2231647 RepID=UPI001962B8D7|nr:prepilin-type N-terminal cleavage/methylation domain-containing protein [Vibrio tetraodonis]